MVRLHSAPQRRLSFTLNALSIIPFWLGKLIYSILRHSRWKQRDSLLFLLSIPRNTIKIFFFHWWILSIPFLTGFARPFRSTHGLALNGPLLSRSTNFVLKKDGPYKFLYCTFRGVHWTPTQSRKKKRKVQTTRWFKSEVVLSTVRSETKQRPFFSYLKIFYLELPSHQQERAKQRLREQLLLHQAQDTITPTRPDG